MIGALVYLQLTSIKNALLGRFRRLRNPRYLFAALVGAAYFYFLVFRRSHHAGAHHEPVMPMQAGRFLELIGGAGLFVAVVLAWILPNSRAALTFTEAEVAFLFPAPISRRTLVHFKLLKSQLSILLSSVILTVISNRWSFVGGGAWVHATGWWVIFSLYNLHLIGASFARERLLGFGINPLRRRLLACGLLVLLGFTTWFWMHRSLPLRSDDDVQNVTSLLDYVKTVLMSPPLGWVLMPFRLVVRPFLAADLISFFSAIWPVLLLLAGHYAWVVSSAVAFEEASIARSQKHAERVAAMRAGKWSGGAPTRKRREPFTLSPGGLPSLAFLWKGLIAAGPMFYPRYWFLAGGLLATGIIWFGRDPVYRSIVGGVVAICSALCVYGLLFGPVLARRGLALMLERMDLVKSYPLRGWQVLLGELLCPVTILCVFEWVMLSLLALAILFLQRGEDISSSMMLTGLVSASLLIVPLAGLLFALNYAGALYFPAWLSATVQQGAGIEKVGQRLIFLVGYLVVLLVALLPATLLGAVPFLLVYLYSDWFPLAIALGSVIACIVLLSELSVALWWLGQRFERFDLSAEMPRT